MIATQYANANANDASFLRLLNGWTFFHLEMLRLIGIFWCVIVMVTECFFETAGDHTRIVLSRWQFQMFVSQTFDYDMLISGRFGYIRSNTFGTISLTDSDNTYLLPK